MRSNREIVASSNEQRAQRAAKDLLKHLIVKRSILHGRDGAFLAGMLQLIKSEKSRTLSNPRAMTVAFHSGKSGDDFVGDVIEMPNGCEVRYGRDCQVGCFIVDVTGKSLLLYVERIPVDGQPDAWRLRRSYSTGLRNGVKARGVSPTTKVFGGRRSH